MSTALLAMLTTMTPASAWADAPPFWAGPPTVIKLALVGAIPPHCGFAEEPPSTANLQELTSSGSFELDFKLDCNAGFAVAVSSSNGALKHVPWSGNTDPQIQGFANAVDYNVSLRYQTDLGTISGNCASAALAGSGACAFYGVSAGHGLSSGNGVAMGMPASLTLSWAPPQGVHLFAGNYTDTITITVGTRI